MTVDSKIAVITTSKGVAVGGVIGVDTTLRVILLDTEGQIMVGVRTNWDRSGNLHSFRELVEAFNRGRSVRLKARGQLNSMGDIKAETIKAIVR